MASGISATTRFVGILLGFTVLSSALTVGIRAGLSARVPADEVMRLADTIATGALTRGAPVDLARAIYSQGFAASLWTAAAAATLASLAVALLRPRA